MSFSNRPNHPSRNGRDRAPEPEVRRALDPSTDQPVPVGKARRWYDGKKTYFGIALALLPTLLKIFGIDLGKEELAGLVDQGVVTADAVIALIGSALAIYGRIDKERRAKAAN